ncbi:MAG: aminotransferase class V-fold PLP-dependent enzyme [Planctomycetaceae bacterium]
MMSPYRELWDLDPEVTYLNHGSFGPSPIEVRAAREAFSLQAERQPMKFFCQRMEEQLTQTAEALAGFLKTDAGRLVLIDNATFAMNIVAESFSLSEGDQVLLTDHEYGAVRNIWQRRCRQVGASVVTAKLPFPLDNDGILTAIEGCLTDRTKLIVVSHITSPTAAILPVTEICQRARHSGIAVAIDGPHAIAMLDVCPEDIGCDFYCGSGHKWLCASFGSGFLWVHPKHHSSVRCPIESWGGSIAGRPASWQDRINWLGTRDPAPLLSISAAIEFLQRIGLDAFRRHAKSLVLEARRQLLELDGAGPLCTPNPENVVSMCSVELPQPADWKPGFHGHPDPLQIELRDVHRIEIPVASWNGRRFLRISAHLYNSSDDVTRLIESLQSCKHLR